MKNLPEEELFNELESRLRQYEEQPDESTWDKVAAALPKNQNVMGWLWAERLSLVAAAIALLMLVGVSLVSTTGSDVVLSNQSIPEVTIKEEVKSVQEVPLHNATIEISAHLPSPSENNSSLKKGRTVPLVTLNRRNVHLPVEGDDRYTALAERKTVSGESPEILIQIPATDTAVVSEQPHDAVSLRTKEKNERELKKKARPQVYFSFSPALAYYKASPYQGDEVRVSGFKSPGIFATERIAWSIEGGIQKQLSKNFEWYAGVSFYSQQLTIGYRHLTSGQMDVVTSNDGMSVTITPHQALSEVSYAMRNVGVSSGLLYTIKTGKLEHRVGAGIQYEQGLVKGDGEAYDNANSCYVNYQLLYRMQYAISGKMTLYVQPTITRSISTQQGLLTPFSIAPHHAGLAMGLLYQF
ncbi:MAG: hypothetical protein JNM57_14060 [Cyclobacteriaceae bacterium]|nr:hypothetical protein [Cyclobacteriaceae bacterium]